MDDYKESGRPMPNYFGIEIIKVNIPKIRKYLSENYFLGLPVIINYSFKYNTRSLNLTSKEIEERHMKGLIPRSDINIDYVMALDFLLYSNLVTDFRDRRNICKIFQNYNTPRRNINGEDTPLMIAVTDPYNYDVEDLEIFLSLKVDPNVKNINKNTALHEAIKTRYVCSFEAEEYLLSPLPGSIIYELYSNDMGNIKAVIDFICVRNIEFLKTCTDLTIMNNDHRTPKQLAEFYKMDDIF